MLKIVSALAQPKRSSTVQPVSFNDTLKSMGVGMLRALVTDQIEIGRGLPKPSPAQFRASESLTLKFTFAKNENVWEPSFFLASGDQCPVTSCSEVRARIGGTVREVPNRLLDALVKYCPTYLSVATSDGFSMDRLRYVSLRAVYLKGKLYSVEVVELSWDDDDGDPSTWASE